MNPTLLVLAAGMGSRFGGLKQVEPVGPSGETLMDYAIFDALRAGFGCVVFVIRRDFEGAFRDTVGRKVEGRVAVDYAYQALDDLPPNAPRPADRVKPWGTAHAVRAARNAVTTPFAAINADDFYGRDSFARLGDYLRSDPHPVAGRLPLAMVGYRLNQTLSEHGAVSRGVCQVSGSGLLQSVTEMTHLSPVPGGVENCPATGAPVRLTGLEPVSMNCWGFVPGLFPILEERFVAWLAAHADDPKAEWSIPTVVNELVQDRRADVRVLPTDSSWFGVTYREDRPRVSDAIRKCVEAGVYPARLR